MDYDESPGYSPQQQVGGGQQRPEMLPSYTQSKLARKKAEEDAKLLQTRIQLLKKQEQKAWKKIQDTKKRAKQILELRQRNQQKARQVEQRKRKQEEEIQNKKQYNKLFHQGIKEAINYNKTSLLKTKRDDVQKNKVQKADQKNMMLLQKQQQLLKNAALFTMIKNQERENEQKRLKDAYEKQRRAKQEVLAKIQRQNQQRLDLENQVSKMEQDELELIQKLQNTQLLQKAAYEDLEKALMSNDTTPSTFESSGAAGSRSSPH